MPTTNRPYTIHKPDHDSLQVDEKPLHLVTKVKSSIPTTYKREAAAN